MKGLKNIFFISSAVLILLPSIVSFSHIFWGHGHVSCNNYAEYHYHSDSIDCDLHKFHKQPALKLDFPDFEPVVEQIEKLEIHEYYRFLNDFEPLAFDLRGPPSQA